MATEVFNNIGETEIYERNPSYFHKRQPDYGESDDIEEIHDLEISDDEIETKSEPASKPLSEAKKEFFEHLEKDSLTIDTCDKLTHDWGKK